VEHGRVEGIFISAEHGVLPQPVERIRALAGKGLEGNRHFYPDGDAPPGRALTLVAAEALEGADIRLSGAETRRNVLTRGIDVNALVGKRFRVGGIECYGVELCEPCAYLQSMTEQGVLEALVHRAGLNADILGDGEIAVGDAVAPG
jgi:MOSC domain-containing protein YiiM